ncbi:thioredoxin family protein [Botrimarina sp.]|uniref:protein-disulfide reductase DsbD family protein n=1 Tax=Botrimarina sp. TaxID=2795802 RepID=UPI0032EC2316
MGALLGSAAAAQSKSSPGSTELNLEGFKGGVFDGLDFGAGQPDGELVTVSARFTAPTETSPAMLAVTAKVADGYHIYSVTQAKGGPQPTKLSINEGSGVRRVGDWVADPPPEKHTDEQIWPGLVLEEHTGEVTWRAPIALPEGADPAGLKISGEADLQACTEVACNAVEATFLAELAPPGSIEPPPFAQPGAPSPTGGESAAMADAASGGLAVKLGFALLGGLILNLMPCVLPVIGLKVLSFAEQAGHDRRRVLTMNLAYSAGLISVFLLLAVLASLAQLGLAKQSFGWGELYTLSWFKVSMVVLVFAMALSFLGVWEIPIPGFAGVGKANDLQAKEGYSGAFFKGVFTTVLATPCSGPFLGPVFGYTLSQPPAITALIFLFVGLGMAAPYLLIGAFPSLIKVLPKPGAWMVTFKQLMGFVLMATVVYLIATLGESVYLPTLATLVGVGFACWWIGSTPLTKSAAARARAWGLGITTAVVTGFASFWALGPSDHELPWVPFSPATLEAAKSQGDTVLVDFTADWCPTCKYNSRFVINTEGVARVVRENGVTPILADWTDRSETIKQTLERLGSRSIPFLAIFPADRPDDPILLPDVLTEEQLLEALASAGAVKANPQATAGPEIEIGEARPAGALR